MTRPLSSNNKTLNPPRIRTFVFCVFRSDGKHEFWDVDCVGLTRQAAFLKAAMVDEMKPEWAKMNPVVRVAKGRFVEERDISLVRE